MPGQTRKVRRSSRGVTRKRPMNMTRRARGVTRKVRGRGPLANFVRKVINRGAESKYVATNVDATGAPLGPAWYASDTITSVNQFRPAIPQVTQGDDDFQRNGNMINPTSIAVSLKIGMNATDLSCNALYGVIYYGTSKNTKTWQGTNPVNSLDILDQGDGTNQQWAGLRGQLNLPTDKKQFNLKRIVFRLSKTQGVQNWEFAPAAPGLSGNYSTSNGSSTRNFLLKFRPPQTLKYNNKTDLYPQNYAPFYVVTFCHADGSAIPAAADTKLVNVDSRVHMYFKDF